MLRWLPGLIDLVGQWRRRGRGGVDSSIAAGRPSVLPQFLVGLCSSCSMHGGIEGERCGERIYEKMLDQEEGKQRIEVANERAEMEKF
ncbi:hypothetical protein E2C01_057732 [Portunus trituberculatus]|uniref:Uncharacterized protein n=1 Tax=Portunus trituberculatus TaxID=210409 RepID=A0A5B7GXU1_PORTR|nr:hypothetical protein [Portunus trituberculatus]